MSVRLRAFRLKKRWIVLTLIAIVGVIGVKMYGRSGDAAGARAVIAGGPLRPELKGQVTLRHAPGGTEVAVDIEGLPPYEAGERPIGPFGFHIHEGSSCQVGDASNPFMAAGGHWNPDHQPHGNHAGDFPVLFSHGGKARMTFLTDRFQPKDVVGKVVIIHQNPDDYRSQPAGDAGLRLGCGVIADHTM